MMEFYNRMYLKARKPHKCEFCGRTIERGEKYSRETGKYDGDFFCRKLCIPCERMLSKFCLDTNEDEFCWWQVNDWLSDTHCEECEHFNDCNYGHGNPSCEIIRKIYGEGKENNAEKNE